MSHYKVDDRPPGLFPELYLKPRRLDFYARQLEENMNVNKELLKRINLIQRNGVRIINRGFLTSDTSLDGFSIARSVGDTVSMTDSFSNYHNLTDLTVPTPTVTETSTCHRNPHPHE